MTDESNVIGVMGSPPAVITHCSHCDGWHETQMTPEHARVLAVQLIVAADRIPASVLIPTVPEPVTED